MVWEKMAKHKLKNYEAVTASEECLRLEIMRLASEYTAIQSARPFNDSFLKAANIRSREDRLLDNLAERAMLKNQLEQTHLWLEGMNNALSTLDAKEKDVINELYIMGETGRLDRLCTRYGCGASSIYRLRDKALKKLTIALYGIDECELP